MPGDRNMLCAALNACTEHHIREAGHRAAVRGDGVTAAGSPPAERRRLRQERDALRGRLGEGRADALVRQLAGVMRLAHEAGATSSLLGLEGPLRHAIRSDLCLQGWAWDAADRMARDLLARAFRALRATRPSWNEGQREWTIEAGTLIERTRCLNCGKPLPEGHHKFCGRQCLEARGSAQGGQRGSGGEDRDPLDLTARCEWCDKPIPEGAPAGTKYCSYVCRYTAYNHLGSEARRAARAGRTCRHCGGPVSDDKPLGTVYCDRACKDAARAQADNTCVVCDTAFQSREHAQYCSARCRGAPLRRPERTCESCGTVFRGRTSRTRFCSRSCASTAKIRARMTEGRLHLPSKDMEKRRRIAMLLNDPATVRLSVTEIARRAGASTRIVREVRDDA